MSNVPIEETKVIETAESQEDYEVEAETDRVTNASRSPRVIREEVSSIMAMFSRSSSSDKIAEKITESHIDKLLDAGIKDDEQRSKDRRFKWVLMTVVLIIVFLFISFVLYQFSDSPHFITIITNVFSLAGGALAGFGIGKLSSQRQDE